MGDRGRGPAVWAETRGRGTEGSGRRNQAPLSLPRTPPSLRGALEEGGRPWVLPWTRFPPCHSSTAHPAPPDQALPGTDLSSPCPGHRGPEETPPVRVLKDVGQHAREKPAAVQDDLLLLLRMAAALGSLHQLLHSLRGGRGARWEGGSGALHVARMGTPGSEGEARPHRATLQTGSASPGGRDMGQPTTHWLRSC